MTGAVRAVAVAASLVLAGCGRTGEPAAAELGAFHDPHWSYDGASGPAHWGALNPDYATCGSGTSQSPIDIVQPVPTDMANIAFHYQPSTINIVDNGHDLELDYDPGSYIEIDSVRYDLLQLHFHMPSEHLIGGRRFDAELHFVHKSAAGRLAVVGLMIEKGADNPAFASIWANLPSAQGPLRHVAAEVSAASLLPDRKTTFRYEGSLTTPPCTELVRWNVLSVPVPLSEAQLTALGHIKDGNSRPAQPRGARALIEDVSP